MEIKQIRQALGLTQAQFGALIGAHSVTVARWETGRNKPRGGAILRTLKQLEQRANAKAIPRSTD